MGIIKLLGFILVVFSLINIVWVWHTYFELKEEGIEIVKCYDRYSNEIIGEECIEDNDDLIAPVLVTILSLFMMAISPFLFHMDSYM